MAEVAVNLMRTRARARERSDLGQQRRGCGAEVVWDEQLGVRVDPCWVELPQWLETVRPLHHWLADLKVCGEPMLTIPVRSSNNKAPRLHQSHASVILDTPPISANTGR